MKAFDFSGVVTIPQLRSQAIFSEYKSSSKVFRETADQTSLPVPGYPEDRYWPWGVDNSMPYDLLEKIEADETVSTCMQFNAEILFGAGISYVPKKKGSEEILPQDAEDFLELNDIQMHTLGAAVDLKHFGFTVSVIVLNKGANKIVRIVRKPALYCRFAEVNARNEIPYVYYGNWREGSPKIERIPLLSPTAPLIDLRERLKTAKTGDELKFAVVSRIPTADNTYYPIPAYGALFRGKWYDIKQLIAIAKEAKIKNSAPIRYHIEISEKYFDRIFEREHIYNEKQQRKRADEEKTRIIEFLTGVENSGKVWFSLFYITPDGKETRDVRINKVDTEKEGGDWASDLQEAVNMICFSMRVHSNLVGSVPGKAQSNNSGSDKRELYTIAQALQLPYRMLLLSVHRLIISFNGWRNFKPQIPFLQLTTLDEHQDSKLVDA